MEGELREQKRTRLKKRAMLKALSASLGIVSIAARNAKINRQTHADWLKADAEYACAVAAIDDIALDYSESKLFMLIKKENPQAVFFHLKTKGKKRGYVEKQELEHEFTSPQNIKVTIVRADKEGKQDAKPA